MAEQARIARFFAPLAAGEPGSFLLTDDAAAIEVPAGQKLVVTTDSVIVGTHVRNDATPHQIAVKLMRRNISDFAAMGASPWRYTLNLHTPLGTNDDWFAAFAAALQQEQNLFDLVLIGGDSTSGDKPFHASLTCYGLANKLLRRNGAKPGDAVYVSGTIGDAALALQLGIQSGYLAERYNTPTPRLTLGQMLHGVATSCIDISDGLVMDASRLAYASEVALHLEAEAVPFSSFVQENILLPDFWNIVSRGDDYELLFTAPEDAAQQLEHISVAAGVPITRIGKVVKGEDASLLDVAGKKIPVHAGWEYE